MPIDRRDQARIRAQQETAAREQEVLNSRSLQRPPAGGPMRNLPAPGQPMQGPTVPLNAPNPNTVRIMNSTGGRNYTANPFNSQQGAISPPMPTQRPIMGSGGPPNMGFGGGGAPPGMGGGGGGRFGAGSPIASPPVTPSPQMQTPTMQPGGPSSAPTPIQAPQFGQQQAVIQALRGRMMR